MTVHLFGATSSPGFANTALKAAADDNEENLGCAAAEFVRRDFYVDDGLKSVTSIPDATPLIEDTKELCRRGGFRLHKFTSNFKEVIEAIPEIDIERDAVVHRKGLFQFRITLKDRPVYQTLHSINNKLDI